MPAFQQGEFGLSVDRAVKRQTRCFEGLVHLALKEPHSAPFSCVISQPVRAYSYSLRRNAICAYARRAGDNTALRTCDRSQNAHEYAITLRCGDFLKSQVFENLASADWGMNESTSTFRKQSSNI